MKLSILTTSALLLTTAFGMPVKAQDTQPITPPPQGQVSGDQVLDACSKGQANTLPVPFTDISPNHWAFKAVMSMYYCGAYRGGVPPEQVKPFLQPQPPQPMSNQTHRESALTLFHHSR
jgi:hypothetical protein